MVWVVARRPDTRREHVADVWAGLLALAGLAAAKKASGEVSPRWMMQVARNVTDAENGVLRGKRYLIVDRDTKYTDEFRNVLVREGIHLIRLPPRSPNLNAFAERFVRSIKSECLNRMIFFGQASLQHAISNFIAHYHRERNHQGVGNRLLQGSAVAGSLTGPVRRRQRLGGMLSFYYCAAA
jgi:putative transposase